MNSHSSNVQNRSGVTLIECLVAVALLSTLAVVLVPFLSRAAEMRTDLAHRQLALVELRNLAELALIQPASASLELSPEARGTLIDPWLEVRRTPINDGLPGEQVTLLLSWINTSGRRNAPLQLSCWRTLPEGTE